MQPDKACEKDGIRCEIFSKYPAKCALCPDRAYYSPEKVRIKKIYTGKKSNRQGAQFEAKNHEANQKLLTTSNLTPNSGAGKIKGDEQITGLVRIMEELKTKVKPRLSRGDKTFTIHREWFQKLDKEAPLENMEFWYLKFKFLETDPDTYVAINEDVLMSMIATLVEDRSKAKTAQRAIDLANATADRIKAENVLLAARIRELELMQEG
jgi:hypothetical protein